MDDQPHCTFTELGAHTDQSYRVRIDVDQFALDEIRRGLELLISMKSGNVTSTDTKRETLCRQLNEVMGAGEIAFRTIYNRLNEE